MSCYFHPGEDSVASCIDCGKGLCRACAAKYEIAICDSCNSKRNWRDKFAIGTIFVTRILPSIVLFGIVFYYVYVYSSHPADIPNAIMFGYFAMAIPWGWGLVGSWFGGHRVRFAFGILDTLLFVFYWFFRIGLAVALGGILFPIEVIRLLIAHAKAKKIDSAIANSARGAGINTGINTGNPVTTTPSGEQKRCTGCGNRVASDIFKCPRCGNKSFE